MSTDNRSERARTRPFLAIEERRGGLKGSALIGEPACAGLLFRLAAKRAHSRPIAVGVWLQEARFALA